METLVLVSQHRNQYYSRSKAHGPGRFGSSPSSNFREINCRTFQSAAGILPTPLEACTTTVTKRPCSSSPKTPSPCANSHSEDNSHLKTTAKSNAIPINIKDSTNGRSFNEELSFSELWAGPAYSNSPPPSSLPIPKFSLKPKRTASLNLPGSASDIKMHPIAKSAPSSPTREPYPSARDFFLSADSATKTLRRILNLDIADEECWHCPIGCHKAYIPWRSLMTQELLTRKDTVPNQGANERRISGRLFFYYDMIVMDVVVVYFRGTLCKEPHA